MQSSAIASGRCEPIVCLLVEELRRRAADERALGQRAHPSDEPLGAPRQEAAAGGRLHLPDAGPELARRQHDRRLRQRRTSARTARVCAAVPRTTAYAGRDERGGEVALERRVDDARRLTFGGRTEASMPVKRMRQGRQRER